MKLLKSIRFKTRQLVRDVLPHPSIVLNNKKFIIPVIGHLGLSNTNLKDEWLLKLVKRLNLPKDSDIIDVGVNLGQSLMAIRSCCENTYWGFEPNPTCVFYVKSLVELNDLNNIHLLPVGLYSENDVVKFYSTKSGDAGATILQQLRPNWKTNASYVPVFCFDELKVDVKNISLIKIDVEGAESDVLKGMKNAIARDQPVIVCEILDCDTDADIHIIQERANSTVEFMKELKYSVYRIIHRGNELNFEPVETLKIVKYTTASPDLNDYIFIPERITSFP